MALCPRLPGDDTVWSKVVRPPMLAAVLSLREIKPAGAELLSLGQPVKW